MNTIKQKYRILLITPPFTYFPVNKFFLKNLNYTRPPLGLCYLSSYIKKYYEQEVDISILDGANSDFDTLIKELIEKKPHLIGVSSMTATINISKKIVSTLKEKLPDTIFVIGGVHTSVRPFDALPDFDAVVVGEGEEKFRQFVEKMIAGHDISDINIPGVLTNYNQSDNTNKLIKDIDQIPFPDRMSLNLKDYYHSYPHKTKNGYFTSMFTSRGCQFNCKFCASNVIFGSSARKRSFSIDYTCAEIDHIVKDLNCSLIFIDDDEFLMQKSKVEQFCNHILKNSYNIRWICHARPESADKDLFKLMNKAGCVEIQVGVESGSIDLLKKMNRNYTIESVSNFFKISHENNIKTWATFVLGYPSENLESLKKTQEIALKTNPTYASFIMLFPYPGTRLFTELEEQGKILTYDWDKYSWHCNNPVFQLDGISIDEIITFRKKLLKSFYLKPEKIYHLFYDTVSSGKFKVMVRNFISWLSLTKGKLS